eukprot:8900262-Heterocapsa_arctica.AAC.1
MGGSGSGVPDCFGYPVSSVDPGHGGPSHQGSSEEDRLVEDGRGNSRVGRGATESGEDGALGVRVPRECPGRSHGAAPYAEVLTPGVSSAAQRADPVGA